MIRRPCFVSRRCPNATSRRGARSRCCSLRSAADMLESKRRPIPVLCGGGSMRPRSAAAVLLDVLVARGRRATQRPFPARPGGTTMLFSLCRQARASANEPRQEPQLLEGPCDCTGANNETKLASRCPKARAAFAVLAHVWPYSSRFTRAYRSPGHTPASRRWVPASGERRGAMPRDGRIGERWGDRVALRGARPRPRSPVARSTPARPSTSSLVPETALRCASRCPST